MSRQKGKLKGWDKAIADGRTKLVEAKVCLSRLRIAIRMFEQRKAAGEPWPGEEQVRHQKRQSATQS